MTRLPRIDVAIATAVAAYGVIEAAVRGAPAPWFAGVLAATLPLAWRRRAPVAVTVWVLALMILAGVIAEPTMDTVLPLPLVVVLGFTCGQCARTAAGAFGGAAGISGSLVAAVALAPPAENTVAEDLVALAVVVGGATVAGRLVRLRQLENVRLGELASRLVAERDERAYAAVLEERARIARELHDVVAHSVSLIAVQAAAAEELLDRDTQRARQSMRAVQDAARGTMTDMRRLLTILREEGDAPGLSPATGLSAVPELVEQARSGGLAVTLRQEGEAAPLPAGLDLSGYRIVQEALTNVRKHAPGAPTQVLVRSRPDELLIEVVNALAGGTTAVNGAGHGIAGMRERVRIYGGELAAGPQGDSFVVRARLPIGGPAA